VLSAEEIERQIREIVSAKSPTDGRRNGAADGYYALFKAIGEDGIRKLQSHVNDAVAVQAAWEGTGASPRDRKWFVGFLEGRARVQAPDWWAAMFVHGLPHRWLKTGPETPKEEPYEKAGLGSVRAPKGTRLSRDPKADGVIVARVGEEVVRVPDDLFGKSDTGHFLSDVSPLVLSDRCYLAVHDDVGYPYRLTCLDRKSGKVVWKSDVFSHFWGAATGQHAMYVAVTEQGGRVVVFGASWTGFHVEAFRPDDGAPLFRFSTGNGIAPRPLP